MLVQHQHEHLHETGNETTFVLLNSLACVRVDGHQIIDNPGNAVTNQEKENYLEVKQFLPPMHKRVS